MKETIVDNYGVGKSKKNQKSKKERNREGTRMVGIKKVAMIYQYQFETYIM